MSEKKFSLELTQSQKQFLIDLTMQHIEGMIAENEKPGIVLQKLNDAVLIVE